MNTNDLNDPMDQNFSNAEDTRATSTESEGLNEQAIETNDSENTTVAQVDDEEIDVTLQPIDLEEEHISDEDEDEDATADEEEGEKTNIDFTNLSKDELVQTLKQLLSEKPVLKIKAEIESIKSIFYRKHKAEVERQRKAFVDAGGDITQFVAADDNAEIQIKEMLKHYRDERTKYNHDAEQQKQHNLEQKLQIIDQIKELVNNSEDVNRTFQEFRQLQQKFRELGPIPQANLNDLWENYHHHVQNFYDFIKINKELRDLDLKKNLEEKINLCEKTEELLIEPSIVNAFKKLQKYHEEWREIGPVPRENQNEIWERFKDATGKINKKHQEHFEGLREDQKKNLDAKVALCEKAEELASMVVKSNKDWNQRSKEMIELQKVWKTIGFAPKKDNNKIYDRFRHACDSFFGNKREFYVEAREGQQNNFQLKTELCIQAESLKDSNEWKKTTEDLISLQKRWKEIGPVPRKHSEELWKRFRAACDYFFNQKSQHFSKVDNSYDTNLKAKEALIAEIEAFILTEDVEANLNVLKDFQRRWAEIGFVPIKQKEEIQKKYRTAINKHFEKLNIEEGKRNLIRFKSKIDGAHGNARQENKLRNERDKLFNRLRQLESDIALWENNIGFFARTKNAEAMIQEVERKIKKAKEEIILLEEKIKLIDQLD